MNRIIRQDSVDKTSTPVGVAYEPPGHACPQHVVVEIGIDVLIRQFHGHEISRITPKLVANI